MLAATFASVSSLANYDETFRRYKLLCEQRLLNFNTNADFCYNAPFSMDEVNAALSSTSDTSPGVDKITYSMIKSAHPSFLKFILNTYNTIYRTHQCPHVWTLAIIIAILKPNKDHLDSENYRPISLTDCLCKLFEKTVKF